MKSIGREVAWIGGVALVLLLSCQTRPGSEPAAETGGAAAASPESGAQDPAASADGAPGPAATGDPSPAAASVSDVAPGPASPDGGAADPIAEAAGPRVDEAAVRALLDAWLAAQNEADFAAYEALYAPRFLGIKRAGPRTFRFDRAGWLSDRRRMFGKQVRVEAGDVQLALSSVTAIATFTQRWSSGRFADVGPKQLVISQDPGPDGALRIAREEMLSSAIVRGAVDAPAASEAVAMPVLDGGFVVLSATPDARWANRRALTLLDRGVTVRAPAHLDRLPAELGAMLGAELTLWGDQGEVCRGKIGAMYVLTRFVPHFGMEQVWNGSFDGEPAMSERQVAADAWELGGEARRLVATVEASEGDCAAALWARPLAGEAPAIYRKVDADGALAAAAIAQLQATAAFASLQREYEAWRDDALKSGAAEPGEPAGYEALWSSYGGATPAVLVFEGADGARVVAVLASSGEGCGHDWQGTLWGTWAVAPGDDDWTWTALSEAEQSWGFTLEAVFDADGDGALELLGGGVLYQVRNGTLAPVLDASIPFYDCPC